MELLPSYYRRARNELIFSVSTTGIEGKKKLYDEFSQKYTMSPDLWEKRIALELPPADEPVTKEIFDVCKKLRFKAMRHFRGLEYFPRRLQELCEDERVPKLEKVYQFCSVILEEAFSIGSCKKIEPFLTFPHSQLVRFNRYHQLYSGKPLPAKIKRRYDKALESYRQMITVAMMPLEWIEWMKSNFDEEDWVANFECKLAEHFYMKEIWLAYIKFLEGQKTTDVFNVYRRYCRIFVKDYKMRDRYRTKLLKMFRRDILPWNLDESELSVDFFRPVAPPIFAKASNRFFNSFETSILKSYLKRNSSKMCKECFEVKNRRYFDGKLNFDKVRLQIGWFWKAKECAPLDCYLCGESFKENELIGEEKVIEVLVDKYFSTLKPRSVEFHPIVRIQFHGSLQPPIPLFIFHYLLENANHQILSKFYASSKYFFIKKLILICGRICFCSNPKESYMQGALWTNVKTILKSPIKKYCCGTTLTFKDSSNPDFLSKCLPKLCCCSLTNLIIFGQNLTVDEFKVLLCGGKMELVSLKEARIFKENGEMMKIEEIIALLPTVTDLRIDTESSEMYTPFSSQKIAALFRNGTKFDVFWLCHVPDTFDLEFFQIFLREHMQLRGYFHLGLRHNVNQLFLYEYKVLLKEIKNNWLPAYQGPFFLM